MLILLHGDNTVASRRELDLYKARVKGKEIITLDGQKVDPTTLLMALESKSLFGGDRLVIIENLLGKKTKTPVENILSNNQEKEIILWEEKEIKKTTISKLPHNLLIKLFKFNKVLFKFLEEVRPGNIKNSLFLFQETLKREEVALVFYMLTRQWRNLIIVKDIKGEKIDDFSPWQLARLTKQARYFTMEQLLKKHHELLKIDIAQKTGTAPFNLKQTTELFLINLNE